MIVVETVKNYANVNYLELVNPDAELFRKIEHLQKGYEKDGEETETETKISEEYEQEKINDKSCFYDEEVDLKREIIQQKEMIFNLEQKLIEKQKELEKYRQQFFPLQLEKSKKELDKLINKAKNKLGEESEFLLEMLLETQIDVVKSTDIFLRKSLGSLQKSLNKKMDKKEIELICQKQKEVTKLEEVAELLGNQTEQQLNIEVNTIK